ncbi:hypothetical protein HMPREF0043_01911 [Actinobaculum sp. oral taxon 183 str. F0552]|nr:hypothetical protein HMPREF0043_01911 [Actinobaculum sp. oral taxon 183 str. F0552]
MEKQSDKIQFYRNAFNLKNGGIILLFCCFLRYVTMESARRLMRVLGRYGDDER